MLNPQAGICPQCQQPHPPDARACSRCGLPLAAPGGLGQGSSGVPSSFNTPFGTFTAPEEPGRSSGPPAAFGREGESMPPGVPPAFGAMPPPPGGHGQEGGTTPGAFGANGAMPPAAFGAPNGMAPPGAAAFGAPGEIPQGMMSGGPAGTGYGAGDPGFNPPPGAQFSPPAHYGQISGPGLPPGMGQHPGFQHPGLPQQPWHAPGPPPAASSNRVTVAVVAILIGSLGIHKFMLGQTHAGIIMIALGLFTCGMASGVIGLIEGIIYLTKNDADFYQTYVVERKAWF